MVWKTIGMETHIANCGCKIFCRIFKHQLIDRFSHEFSKGCNHPFGGVGFLQSTVFLNICIYIYIHINHGDLTVTSL